MLTLNSTVSPPCCLISNENLGLNLVLDADAQLQVYPPQRYCGLPGLPKKTSSVFHASIWLGILGSLQTTGTIINSYNMPKPISLLWPYLLSLYLIYATLYKICQWGKNLLWKIVNVNLSHRRELSELCLRIRRQNPFFITLSKFSPGKFIIL